MALALSGIVYSVLSAAPAIAGDHAMRAVARTASRSWGARPTFDIPSQPLATALEAYNAVTGVDVFYDGAAAAGRQAQAVTGELAPEQALRLLLEGTGFVIVPSGSGGYTLVHAPDRAASDVALARMAQDRPFLPYFAVIQAAIQAALCRAAPSWAASDRVLVRVRIDPSGRIEHAEIGGTNAHPDRDADLVAVLRAVTLREPPPAGMPQPVTMALFPPRGPGASTCGKDSVRRASR